MQVVGAHAKARDIAAARNLSSNLDLTDTINEHVLVDSAAGTVIRPVGHVSRCVPGYILRDSANGQAYPLEQAKIMDILRSILDDHVLKLGDRDLSQALNRDLERWTAIHRDIRHAERAAYHLPGIFSHVSATESAIQSESRFQLPEGSPSVAKLLIIGNYPTGHSAHHALTPAAFSTGLMLSCGIRPPSTSGDYSVAFVDRLCMHFPVGPAAGAYYAGPDSDGRPVSIPISAGRLWDERLVAFLGGLHGGPGRWMVFAYGGENALNIDAAVTRSEAEGTRLVWRWTHRFPAPEDFETGVENGSLSVLRAFAEGIGKSEKVAYEMWIQNSGPCAAFWSIAQAELWQTGMKDSAGSGGQPSSLSWVAGKDRNDRAATLYIKVPHPQNVDRHSSTYTESASLDLATQFATDFVNGHLSSTATATFRGFPPPTWPFAARPRRCQRPPRSRGRLPREVLPPPATSRHRPAFPLDPTATVNRADPP